MNVFMFPGQGAQARGMGAALFDTVREFADVEPQVDALLGCSLRALCLDDPDNRLKETQYTQPCLYIVNALHYYRALAEGERPDALAGHSLGEYNALLAAGAFDLLTGLRLVLRRGALMAKVRDGSMTAILGLDPTRIAALLREHGLDGVDIANYNAPTQAVISGRTHDVERAARVLEQAGAAMCVALPVSAAFHSRHMAAAAVDFDDYIGSFKFQPLRLPVIANVTGLPYPAGDPSATVRALLVRQIAGSVMWTQSVRTLVARGATAFSEIGPGGILTRLVQQIRPQGQEKP
jgi:malonyl CoA-acyl carrier protein transacylase